MEVPAPTRGSLGRRRLPSEPVIAVCIAFLAAVPSLIWGWSSATYLSDDHWLAFWFDDLGVVEAMRRIAFEMPARVLAAPYYLVVYEGIGNRPLLQAVVLAVANGGLVLVMWQVGRRVLPPAFVLSVCVVFAVLPNRSSTRLWFVAGTYPLALLAVFAGVGVLLAHRHVAAGAILGAAVLLYEGVAGLALCLVLLAFLSRRVSLRGACTAGGLSGVAALVAYLISPRRASSSGVGPFGAADTLGSGLLGRGLTDGALTGLALAVVLMVLVGVAVATLLPGFRKDTDLLRRVRLGALLALAGAGPALVGGSAFAVAGLGDRSNLVPSIGVAIIIAAALEALSRRGWIGVVATAAAVSGMFALTIVDVGRYADAADEGERLRAAIDSAFPGEPPTRSTLVIPALDSSPGVAAFVPNIDLRGAMHLRRGGDWSALTLVETVDCAALAGRWLVVDFEHPDRHVAPAAGARLRVICDESASDRGQ